MHGSGNTQDRRLGRRGLSIAATVSVTAIALMAPAAGHAATTIGQLGTTSELVDGGSSPCVAGRVYTQRSTAGGATYDLPTSPTVITSWATTIRPQIMSSRQGALKVLANNGNDTFTVLATSPAQTLVLSSGNHVNRFSVRIPTPGGGQLAYAPTDPAGTNPPQKCYFEPAAGGTGNLIGHGPSSGEVGTSFTRDNAGGAGFRMSIEATFEADADGDGFGDETQDRCPSQAGTSGPCSRPAGGGGVAPDTTKPSVGVLRFSRSSFAAARSGGAYAAQRKKTAPVGTRLSFSLTEAASVRFSAERKSTGRRSGGKCRTRTRGNRRKPKCTLWKKVSGSFAFNGKAGANSLTFRGRIGGRALKTGAYRLTGTATDAARNASPPRRKTFTIVR